MALLPTRLGFTGLRSKLTAGVVAGADCLLDLNDLMQPGTITQLHTNFLREPVHTILFEKNPVFAAVTRRDSEQQRSVRNHPVN